MSRLKHPVARWIILLVLFAGAALAISPAHAEAVVTVCTQEELEARILEARENEGDGVVTFDCDGVIQLTNTIFLRHYAEIGTNDPGWGNSITLDGTGRGISINGLAETGATNGVRLFLVDSGVSLILTNINFFNGAATNGAAIYLATNSSLIAVSCTFSNNIVTGSNGLAGASARTDTVDGKGGGGRSGAAAVASSGGGAIYNLGYAWFSHCAFLTNGVFAGNGGSAGNGGNGTVRGGDGGHGGRGGAALGGAIYNQGRLVTTNCSFYANFALGGLGGEGGAGGTGVFSGQQGRGAAGGGAAGGAIYNHPKSSATNINTTFAANVTDSGDSADGGSNSGPGKAGAGGPHSSGGAIANFGTNALLNCTFFSNGANAGDGGSGSAGTGTGGRGGSGGSAWGGNLFNGKKATLIVTHCTISDGGAIPGTNGVAGGGGLAGRDGARGSSRGANIANSNGTFLLRNSIIAYAANGTNGYYTGKAFTFDGRNISSDRSFKPLSVPKASVTLLLTNLDPRLDTLSRNGGAVETIRLLDDSPAINMATNNYGLTFDARGVSRPAATNVDLGAYEYGIGLVAPRIVSHPEDVTGWRSNSVIFMVTVQGDPPFTYQWRRNGTAISGATGSTYVLTNAQETSEGNYDVLVSNNSGSVESDAASLTVVIPATITSHPSSLILAPGATGTFSVTAEGDGALSYRWLSNGIPILGAVRSVFTLTNAHPVMNASYSVQVANQYRTVVSTAASLVVTSIPPVILFSPTNYTVLGGHPASFTAAVSAGTVPLTFLWYLIKDGATNLQAPLESFEFTNTYAINDAQAANEGSYFVVVTNYGGRATSALASLAVQLVAPVITTDVEDQVLAAGDSAYFNFGVFGSRPVTFQWYSNQTVLISGATNSSLLFTNLSTNSGGTFSVVASNAAGMITSRLASLVITNLPPTVIGQPATSFTLRGQDATFAVAARGSRPFSYQWYFNGDTITNATNATLTVSDVDLEDTAGTYFVEVTNDYGFDSSDDTATVYLLEPIEVNCANQTCTITMPQVDADAMAFSYTLQYRPSTNDAWIGVETLSPDSFDAEFEYTPQPFNADSRAYRVVITEVDPDGAPIIVEDPQDVGVTDGQNAVFTVSAVSSEPLSYRWYFNDALLAGETQSTLIVTNAQSGDVGSYHVVVYGILGASQSAAATLTVVTDPSPALIEQPSSVSLLSGEDATFSVTVFGAAPLSYQWYLNETNLIAGVNSSTLTVSNAQTADAGSYQVVVSNSFGLVTSSLATLAVSNTVPVVLSYPEQTLTPLVGDTVTLTVTAIGSRPLTYQWYSLLFADGGDGAPIAGATNAVLSFEIADHTAVPEFEGLYWVEITNPFGTTSTVDQQSIVDVP